MKELINSRSDDSLTTDGMSNYKTLPRKLRRNGFDYTLVQRGERSFIYAQTVSEIATYYEVFKKRIRPEKLYQGRLFRATEKFPHSEAFGEWAWTYGQLDRAIEKFNKLENEGSKSI